MSQVISAFRRTAFAVRSSFIDVASTRPDEVIEITDRVRREVDFLRLVDGVLNVQTLHTTTGVIVNEDEPLLHGDLSALFERLAPRAGSYHHDDLARRTVNLTDRERRNGHAHCRAALLPSAVAINVVEGALVLGRWQRILFMEHDGPQQRRLSVVAMGEVR
jgi:secondary thiamine-phosphate synthase enzyme